MVSNDVAIYLIGKVHCQVANIPNAATNMIRAATHPTTFVKRPFEFLPMIFLSLEMIIMSTSNGGARTPFITAVQKSALMGLMPMKLMSIPMIVDRVITA